MRKHIKYINFIVFNDNIYIENLDCLKYIILENIDYSNIQQKWNLYRIDKQRWYKYTTKMKYTLIWYFNLSGGEKVRAICNTRWISNEIINLLYINKLY